MVTGGGKLQRPLLCASLNTFQRKNPTLATFQRLSKKGFLLLMRYHDEIQAVSLLKSTYLAPSSDMQLKPCIVYCLQSLRDSGIRGIERIGSTAIVAIVDKSSLVVANLGDSRCILTKKKGKVVDLSKDQKPEKEKKRIVRAGGSVKRAHGKSVGKFNGTLMNAFHNLENAMGKGQPHQN